MPDNGRWSEHNEKLVVQVRNDITRASLRRGCPVIVDDTNLLPRHGRRICQVISGINTEQGIRPSVSIRDFTAVPLEPCIERDAKRDQPAGEKVIRAMYRQFLALVAEPAYEVQGTR